MRYFAGCLFLFLFIDIASGKLILKRNAVIEALQRRNNCVHAQMEREA